MNGKNRRVWRKKISHRKIERDKEEERERKDIESVDDVLRQCCSIASGFGRQLSGQI